MTLRLQHIEITNFKAFRHFELPLEGRHLLVYGANGSGKSSLYWALYTFLQSADKERGGAAKYFEPGNPQCLLNIHEPDPVAVPGEIAITVRDDASLKDTVYRVNRQVHGTFEEPVLNKANLASDFVSYRFFFGFSHFRNSEDFDLWPLFEKEILPFCVSTSGQLPRRLWKKIAAGDPNPSGARGSGGAARYKRFTRDTETFASALDAVVDSIEREAQKFYNLHFKDDDLLPVTLRLRVVERPHAEGTNQNTFSFHPPRIGFGVQLGTTPIARAHSFLNEAKLTQLALSVRLGAALANLRQSDQSPLKLLVLDDLLVSLDMSNRMEVVELLLSDTFSEYQKIIFTHDLGFFREFRRCIGEDHSNWHMIELELDGPNGVKVHPRKTDLQKAQDYLEGHDLEEAAMCLRKAAEHSARRYREQVEGKSLPPGRFISLTDNLRAARNRLLGQLPQALYEKVIEGTPKNRRVLLIPANDTDLDANKALSSEERDLLKHQRKQLRRVLDDGAWQAIDQIHLLDRLLDLTERVLNPASHGGDAPLYEAEVRRAMTTVSDFVASLR